MRSGTHTARNLIRGVGEAVCPRRVDDAVIALAAPIPHAARRVLEHPDDVPRLDAGCRYATAPRQHAAHYDADSAEHLVAPAGERQGRRHEE